MNSLPLPDPRTNPYRPDLAADWLRDRVAADRYVTGRRWRCARGHAAVRGDADATARVTSQLLYGESFTVYDRRGDWAWGQCAADGYVGWLDAAALAEPGPDPSHFVAAQGAFLFPEPSLKAPPLDLLPFGARLAAVGDSGGYLELAGGGFVYGRVTLPVDQRLTDPVATARRLLGLPYLWGGRGGGGIDCSGLIQAALLAAGLPCPRDSDQQRDAVGGALAPDAGLRRGDLVFFPGHVGLMTDDATLLHANAWHMQVTEEPLAAVVGRVDGTSGRGIIARRRP